MAEILQRLIRAAHLQAAPRREIVEARPDEMAALASLYGLPGIGLLRGLFTLRAEPRGVIAAHLLMSARLTRVCVLTLDEFTSDIDEAAELRFIPAAAVLESGLTGGGGAAPDATLDAAALTAPDDIPYAGGLIDLGAALAEQLALGLDPYPRKPGAAPPAAAAASASPVSPFAKLLGRPG